MSLDPSSFVFYYNFCDPYSLIFTGFISSYPLVYLIDNMSFQRDFMLFTPSL